MNQASELAQHWRLNPEVAFLNHGSFGATPDVVLQEQRRLQVELERDPIWFLGIERTLGKRLAEVRQRIAPLVGAQPQDVGFVGSATQGVNAVVRSFSFEPGDEVVITSHGYNACNNAVRFAAERMGAGVVVADIPFPIQSDDQIVEGICRSITDRTRLVLVDHVTSPTGIIFPIGRITEMAHKRGVRVLVDGAHAPGMIPVDVTQLGADYYTANHHKWLCAPKASGFLYVNRAYQNEVRPLSISHSVNTPREGISQFVAEFDWGGTYDPTPVLATPAAIDFLEQLRPGGWSEHFAANQRLALQAREVLAEVMRVDPPAPTSMIGSLVTIPLPGDDWSERQLNELRDKLFHTHRIEVPIFHWGRKAWVRISAQAYNTVEQYQKLGEAILKA